MRLRGLLVGVPLWLACHAPVSSGDIEATVPSPSASGTDAGRPQVQLTWRLFEIQHELDRNGDDVQSAIFELLVSGGTPPRVALGRRSSAGCAVHDAAEGPGTVSSLECRAGSHAEVARVVRSAPGALRVEAYGQDDADAGTRASPRTATVTIPADAEVVVDPGLARIPDETPTK
jgi:hypothetical protein